MVSRKTFLLLGLGLLSVFLLPSLAFGLASTSTGTLDAGTGAIALSSTYTGTLVLSPETIDALAAAVSKDSTGTVVLSPESIAALSSAVASETATGTVSLSPETIDALGVAVWRSTGLPDGWVAGLVLVLLVVGGGVVARLLVR